MSLSDPDPMVIGIDDRRGSTSGRDLDSSRDRGADHDDPRAVQSRWCCQHPDCALVEGVGSGLSPTGAYQRAIDHFFDQHPLITAAQRRIVEGS